MAWPLKRFLLHLPLPRYLEGINNLHCMKFIEFPIYKLKFWNLDGFPRGSTTFFLLIQIMIESMSGYSSIHQIINIYPSETRHK